MKSVTKEEFMKLVDGCNLPDNFDQNLLDKVAASFGQWGDSFYVGDRSRLMETFGRVPRKEDSETLKAQKDALSCVLDKIFGSQVSKHVATNIMRNFNVLMKR
jgi:hypothetical protein